MNPRVVKDRQDLIQMLKSQVAEQPALAAQLTPALRLVETSDDAAKALLDQFAEAADWGLGKGVGYFNVNALSTLPFLAATSLQMDYPKLLDRAKISGQSLANVKVRATPDDEVYAKASRGNCCVSVGLLNVIYCVLLYLFCLDEEMAKSQGCKLSFSISSARSRLLRFLDLDLNLATATEFVDENFRVDSYRAFVEISDPLEKLGIRAEAVNGCLQKADRKAILSAFVLARLSICFITLHELAHYHFGHTHLLEIWRDAPSVAEKVMRTGFPSADARRAMESLADVWATETLIVSETLFPPVLLTKELSDRGIPRIGRAKWVYAAITLTFTILSAVDSINSGTNAAWEDFMATLKGEIDSMYPGGMSRSVFALRYGPQKAISNHTALRWLHWRTMSRDLKTIDENELNLSIFLLWPSCGLAGGFLDFKTPRHELQPEEMARSDGKEKWYPSDRFDYVKAHRDLSEDLLRAKKWAEQRV